MEGCDFYGGDIILPRTGGCDTCGNNIVLPRTGSDEPVPGVTPCWTGVEECDIYESDVALRRTGSDQIVNNAVSTVDPGAPGMGPGR